MKQEAKLSLLQRRVVFAPSRYSVCHHYTFDGLTDTFDITSILV